MEEVRQHNKHGDAWIVVEGNVYDVSTFMQFHPGGVQWLVKAAGTDATDSFKLYHAEHVLHKYHSRLCIGRVSGYNADEGRDRPEGSFGDLVPYGDPAWYQRLNSPYYNDSHRQWRARVRKFVDEEIIPTQAEWSSNARCVRYLVRVHAVPRADDASGRLRSCC